MKMKQWIARHHHWINTAISVVAFAVGLLALFSYGDLSILFTLFLALVLISIGLQIYANYSILHLTTGHKDSQKYIHEAVHTIRNAYYYLRLCKDQSHPKIEFNESDFKEYLISAMTAASIAFSLTTRKECRTCIKIVSSCQEGKNLCLDTLARDRESTEKCKQADENLLRNPTPLNEHDTVYKIMSGHINFYISNDLSQSKESDYFKSLTHYDKKDALSEDWPLPYISTILSPIRYSSFRDEYSRFNDISKNENELYQYYGFFAVDSKHKNIFTETEHEMVAIISDALFPLLDLYRQF